MSENKDKEYLLIDFPENFPDELIKTDLKPFLESGLEVVYKKKEKQIFAALEWTIPTAIVVYILKPYIESFLKEAGKQHFTILSENLKKLTEKRRKIKVKLIASNLSPKKLNENFDQSMAISLLIQTSSGKLIKLLFDNNLDKSDWDSAIDQIFEYIIEQYENDSSNKLNDVTKGFEKDIRFRIYAKLNKESKKLEFYDDKKLLSEKRNKNNS